MIAGRNLAPDAFGEAVENDAFHADRQQAELLAAQAGYAAQRTTARSGARCGIAPRRPLRGRSEEHTSELQSLMRISYAVFCLKKKKHKTKHKHQPTTRYN